MADALLDYGDGGNWNGNAGQSLTAYWQTDFGSSSSTVEFPITAGQSAAVVAENLSNAWNARYPYEASIQLNAPTTLRFDRNGRKPTGMAVKVGASFVKLEKSGIAVPVGSGLFVSNVQPAT